MKWSNNAVGYFDLFRNSRTTLATAYAAGKKQKPTLAWQLALFASLILGVTAKGILEYLSGDAGSIVTSWPRLLGALCAAIVAFPGAYRKAMDESGPGVVQCCVAFTTGLGVKSLFDMSGGDE